MLVPGTTFSIYAGSIEIDALETLMHLQSFNKLVRIFSDQIEIKAKLTSKQYQACRLGLELIRQVNKASVINP